MHLGYSVLFKLTQLELLPRRQQSMIGAENLPIICFVVKYFPSGIKTVKLNERGWSPDGILSVAILRHTFKIYH